MNPRITELINRHTEERRRAREERSKNPEGVSDQTSPSPQTLVPPLTENQVPDKPFDLLGLPLEIRQLILRHVLCTRTTRTVTRTTKPRLLAELESEAVTPSHSEAARELLFRRGHFVEYGIETAVLRICVQLSEEGSKILQRDNKFVAVPSLNAYFRRDSRPNAGRISNIPIWVWPKAFRSKVKPILTLKAKDRDEANCFISVLDLRLYCRSVISEATMHPEYCPELWEFKFLPGLRSYQWGCAGGRVLTIDGNVSPAVQTVRLIETGPNGGKSMAVSDLSQPPELKTLEEWVWDHVNESNIRFDTKTPCQHVEAIFAEAEKLIQSGHVAKGQAKFERVKEILGSLEPARYLSAPRHFPEAVHPEMQARLRWSCFRLCIMKTTIERRGVDYTRDRFYQPQDLLEVQWAYLHAWLALQGQGDVPVCRGYTARVIFRQAELKFILNYCSDEISPLLCKAALYAAPDHCLPPNAQPSESAAWVHHYVHGDDAENWEIWNPHPDPPYHGRGWKICSVPDQWEAKFRRMRDLLGEVYDDGVEWAEFVSSGMIASHTVNSSWPSYW